MRPTCLRSTWPPAASSCVRSRGDPCQNSARASVRFDGVAASLPVGGGSHEAAAIANSATTLSENLYVIEPREQRLLNRSEIVLPKQVRGQVGASGYECLMEIKGWRGGYHPFLSCAVFRGPRGPETYCFVADAACVARLGSIVGSRSAFAPLPASAIHSQTRRPFPLGKARTSA